MARPKKGADLPSNDQLIAEALREAHRPLSAYDLIDRLRNHGVNAPTTVYRALNRLMGTGQVHRLESLNAFVCCARNCRHGTAVFAICEPCGVVAEFDDDVIAKRLATWAHSAKFLTERTTIELRGRCGACCPKPVEARREGRSGWICPQSLLQQSDGRRTTPQHVRDPHDDLDEPRVAD